MPAVNYRASAWRRIVKQVKEDRNRLMVFGFLGLALFFLLVYPLGHLFLRSFTRPDVAGPTLLNYQEILTHPDLLSSLLNSFKIAFGVTLATILIAVPMAWAAAVTDMPGKNMIKSLTVLTFASPSFLGALAWMILLGPRGGRLNILLQHVLGFAAPPFNAFSLSGIIFVLGLFLYPMVFFVVNPALENMDASLEEGARITGASGLRAAWTITLPLVAPSILAGSILVFIEAMVMFDVPAVLGTPVGLHTLSTRMYAMFDYPPRFEMAAALAIPMVIVLILLQGFQKYYLGRRQYAVVTGKSGRRQAVRLGFWRWPLALYCFSIIFLSVGLPFFTLLYSASLKAFGLPFSLNNFGLWSNFNRLLSQPVVGAAIRHSLVLAIVSLVLALGIGMLGAWVVERTRFKGKNAFATLMMLSFAFPGVALGVGLVLGYAGAPFHLYGTLGIFVLAYTTRGLPLGFMFSRSALKQVSPDLEEAARILGASYSQTLWNITIPLIRTSLFSAGVILFVTMFRELGTSVFLQSSGTEVVSPVIFEYYQEVRFPLMATMSVLVMTINLGAVSLARKLFGNITVKL